MEKVLVTGATGFLGKHTALMLNNKGYSVYGTGRNLTVGRELKKMGVEFFEADIRDLKSLDEVFSQNYDYVVHCAALSSPWGSYRDFYSINVEGTRNILSGAKKIGVKKFIHISTPSIYFDFSEKGMVKEDQIPDHFANHYAKTKFMAEELVDKEFENGMSTVTLRPRAIFGIGDNAIFPRIIKANDKTGIPLINEGKHLVDVTCVENVAHAIYLSINADKQACGRKYNITNGEPIEFIEILKMLFEYMGKELKTRKINYNFALCLASSLEFIHKYLLMGKIEPVFTKSTLGLISKTQTLDITLARNLLGYEPQITTQQGLERFADHWRAANG